MLKAKAVVPDKFWILKSEKHKVGNIELTQQPEKGYRVKLGTKEVYFKTLNNVKERLDIEFVDIDRATNDDPKNVHGYPTECIAFDATWDAHRRLPLFTKEPRSRSWYVAGHFQILKHKAWRNIFCPKLILLDRYPFRGPFKEVMVQESTKRSRITADAKFEELFSKE